MFPSTFVRLAIVAAVLQGVAGRSKAAQDGNHEALDAFSSPQPQDAWLRKLQMVTPLITGGNRCPVDRFPYMVSIRDVSFEHICGGVLLNRFWVLTAAHCLGDEDESLYVVAGSILLDHGGEGEELFVARSIPHPSYNGEFSDDNDIALLELSDPTTKVQVFANLPEPDTRFGIGQKLIAIGWGGNGRRAQDKLSCSQPLGVVGQNRCNDLLLEAGFDPISSLFICAFNQDSDACQGDSGGPLIDAQAPNGNLIDGNPELDVIGGLTSSGPPCNDRGDVPGVYTFLPKYREWIETTMIQGGDILLEAAANGDLETVESELAKGVDIESRRTSLGTTPLMEASDGGHVDVVSFLLDNGADIEAKDDGGFTALALAASSNQADVVELLLEEGADVNSRTDFGLTPLHFAAEVSGGSTIIFALIDAGATIDAVDDDGDTPLIFAADLGRISNVQSLLDEGADPFIENRFGYTAEDEICLCLESDDLNSCNVNACRNRIEDLIDLLS